VRYERIPDLFPTLRGGGLLLRELTEADLAAWFGRLTDPEAAALAGDALATSMQTVIDGLAHHRDAFRTKEAVRWSIVPDAVGESVGSIGLGAFDAGRKSASLGGAIGRRHWALGIMPTAARLVTDYAFSALALEEITASTLPENARVIRVLEKLGFERVHHGSPEPIGDRTDTLSWRLTK
jgi:[ribosomal protein S5]-alanine N-acetyltransferase